MKVLVTSSVTLLITMILAVFTPQAVAEKGFDLPEYDLPEYSKVYDDQRSPFKDATAALALAKETNRQVLIEIGGDWCSWCHKMDAFLSNNPDVYQALHANYVLLKINVSDSNENKEFMQALPPVLGYPHMYISSANGEMLLSKDTAELLAGNNYSREYWLTFLNKWSVENNQASRKAVSDETKATQQESGK